MRTIYNMLVSLLICAALFLAPVTAANYDADFDLDTEMIGGLCPLSTAVINADLENTGVLDDEYMLSSSSSW
ncbi:MAG: hypothetical protein KAK00_06865, partial [Nanoarchaeota archaeon]|nr:hypothetical protein [Nanoarchaeota archaeon]